MIDAHGPLWAIACFFNPHRSRTRLLNYREFRQRLTVPLATVELSYDGQFELGAADANILRQLPGRDVMWQKERLLNVALAALPRDCKYVAWLDGDVLFAEQDWAARAIHLLERFAVIQLFQNAHYLDADWTSGRTLTDAIVCTRPSLVSGVASGLPVDVCWRQTFPERRLGTFANGLAWAARRDLLDQHGFFDANIIGGGDKAIVCGAVGCFQHEIEWHSFNERQQEYYLAWAVPFHAACRGEVSHLEGDIYHLWHGDASSGGLGSRQKGLERFDFDPHVDIAVDENGCWRWNSDKREMHQYVSSYFASRREDG